MNRCKPVTPPFYKLSHASSHALLRFLYNHHRHSRCHQFTTTSFSYSRRNLVLKMSTHENQKKGVMYVYKLDTGHHLHPQTPPPPISNKVASRSWGLLKRSKTYREKELNQQHYEKEDQKEMVQESARKSVSVMEGGRKSVSVMELPGRRSVGNTTEMSMGNVAPVAALMQVRVLVTDMPPFMQIHGFRCARQTFDSLERFSPKQIALNLKKEFDKVYGPAWHCIVGSNFGSFVTHATGCFLYFSMEKLYILVFKTKVKKTVN